jgi:photosystem II stability/assembly factor-like uncharacterized protein
LAASPALTVPDKWTPIGPLGGSITSVAVNQNHCDSIYAVTGGNLYVTGDHGSHWEHITAAPGALYDIYIDPERTGTLYGIAFSRLYRSTDSGASWTELSAYVYSFEFDPQDPGRIYAGSKNGILRKSTDRGSTWDDLATGSSWDIESIAVSHANSNTIYTGTMGDGDFPGDGIFKTTDGGLTWFPADSLLPSTNIYSLVIDPLLPETVYAGTMGSWMYSPYGVWRSADGGLSWEEANGGLPAYSGINMLKAVPGQSGHLYTSLHNYEGYNGLYESTDFGVSWTEVDLGLDPGETGPLEFCPQETDALFIGTDSGLLKMTSWYDRAALIGVAPVSINEVAVDPYDTDVIYAGGLTIYKSENGGSSWDIFNTGLGPLDQGCEGIVIDPANTDVIFTGHYYSGADVYKSSDGAATWAITLADLSINDIVIDPHGSDTLYAGGLDAPFVGGLFKTIDSGGSWSKVDTSVIISIALDPNNPGVLYTGTSKEGVKKSINGGATWSFINNGLPEPGVLSNFFHGIAIDPVDPDILYCGPSGAGVYKSTNGGDDWFEASSGLPSLDVRDIEIDPIHPSVLYAGLWNNGVCRSIDGASSWESMNFGLPAGLYVNVEIDPVSPNILYGCCSAGLFRYESSFDPTTDDETVTDGNHPNALINGTMIEYSLELPCHVRMKVYDVAGREVASLIDQRQSAGSHTVGIKTDRLSSGVYFVRMTFGSRSITKKYILIR